MIQNDFEKMYGNDRGFLMIDQTGNCVLVKLAYVDTDTFVKGSLRRGCTAKQLDKIVRNYRKTGKMLEEDDLK